MSAILASIAQIKAAIGAFFIEFSKLEMDAVGLALRALSKETVFVEQAEKLLGLQARLTLLERMSLVRSIPAQFTTELAELALRTRKLHAQREDLANALVVLDSEPAQLEKILMPSLVQIEALSVEVVELQEGLCAFANKVEDYLSRP